MELLREADEAEAAAAALRPTLSVEEEVATIARAEALAHEAGVPAKSARSRAAPRTTRT